MDGAVATGISPGWERLRRAWPASLDDPQEAARGAARRVAAGIGSGRPGPAPLSQRTGR